MKNQIEKRYKGAGRCMACDKPYTRTTWFAWYSLFDGELISENICKKCANREVGRKHWKDEYDV